MAFDHLIQYDEATREIVIYRVYPDGLRHLYTRAPFPEMKEWDKAANQFAQQREEPPGGFRPGPQADGVLSNPGRC